MPLDTPVRVNTEAFASLDAHSKLAPLFGGSPALTAWERRVVETFAQFYKNNIKNMIITREIYIKPTIIVQKIQRHGYAPWSRAEARACSSLPSVDTGPLTMKHEEVFLTCISDDGVSLPARR